MSGLSPNITKNCKNFLTDFQDNLNKKLNFKIADLSERENHFIQDTGFFPGMLGRFRSCLNTTDMTYWIGTTFINDTRIPIPSGVCAPSECNGNDLNELFSKSGVNVMPEGSYFQYQDYRELTEIYAKSIEPGFGFWAFWVILIVFSIFGIVFTIMNQIRKHNEER